jgi:choline-sulfatase
VDENVSLVDLYPTFLDLAGLSLPEGIPFELDGHSLAPFLRRRLPAGWADEVFMENNGDATIKPIRALVKGRCKYIYVHERPDQLYDLARDPDEWCNVVDDPAYASLAAALRSRLLEGWDPGATERRILESQRRRMFLKEALYQGTYAPWDYQPRYDATRLYVRRASNVQWDPHLGR